MKEQVCVRVFESCCRLRVPNLPLQQPPPPQNTPVMKSKSNLDASFSHREQQSYMEEKCLRSPPVPSVIALECFCLLFFQVKIILVLFPSVSLSSQSQLCPLQIAEKHLKGISKLFFYKPMAVQKTGRSFCPP